MANQLVVLNVYDMVSDRAGEGSSARATGKQTLPHPKLLTRARLPGLFSPLFTFLRGYLAFSQLSETASPVSFLPTLHPSLGEFCLSFIAVQVKDGRLLPLSEVLASAVTDILPGCLPARRSTSIFQ